MDSDGDDRARVSFFHGFMAAMHGPQPRQFIEKSDATGILHEMLPELHNLKGVLQPPQYHPEGDAFVHSLLVLDKVAARTDDPVTRFAALYHDIGKGVTPRELWPRHIGHDTKGARLIETLALPLPPNWIKAARTAAALHMKAVQVRKPGKLVSLIGEAEESGLGFMSLTLIAECDDMTGTKPLPYDPETVYQAFLNVTMADAPHGVTSTAAARWLHGERARKVREIGTK
jgi:tRNA nucleotidyltransferase (CCA-adding enzyme)